MHKKISIILFCSITTDKGVFAASVNLQTLTEILLNEKKKSVMVLYFILKHLNEIDKNYP